MSFQLISLQNRSLFLMIIKDRLWIWWKPSSQSFRRKTQRLLKLKLARLKLVATILDIIKLAGGHRKSVTSISPYGMIELAVGETVNMAHFTWVISKPISKAECDVQEKMTRSPLPSPLSLSVFWFLGWACACLHCSSDRLLGTPTKTRNSWKPDGFVQNNNTIYYLD